MKLLLQAGLKATESLWPAIRQAYALVLQAAHLLTNVEHHEEAAIKHEYECLLETMLRQQDQLLFIIPLQGQRPAF